MPCAPSSFVVSDPTTPSLTAAPAPLALPGSERVRPWHRHLIALLVIVLAGVAFMNPIFRGKTFSAVPAHQNVLFPWAATQNGAMDTFPQTDQADTFHPFTVFADRFIDAGDLPLWNPISFGGTPFLANGATGLLDPVRLGLIATTSPSWTHDLLLLSRLILIGVAMYLLCWHLGLRHLGSLFGAITWQFSSFTLGWLQLETYSAAAIAIPLGIVLIDRVMARPSATRIWAAATVLGLGVISTNIQTAVVIGVVLALYTVPTLIAQTIRARSTWLRYLRQRLLALIGVLAGAALVAAPLFLVSLQIVGHVSRSPFPLDRLMNGVHQPTISGVLEGTFTHPQMPPTDISLHALAYVGLIPAIFAVIGFFLRGRASTIGRWFAIITLPTVTTTFMTVIAYHTLPGFSSFKNVGRLLFLWQFAVILLGAAGFHRFVTRFGGVVDRAVAWRRSRAENPSADDAYRRPVQIGILAVAVALIAITAVDVMRVGRGLNPPFRERTAANLYPETPAIAAARESLAATGGRLLPLTYSRTKEIPFTPPVFYGSAGLLYPGIRTSSGLESLVPRRVSDFWRLFGGEPLRDVAASEMTDGYVPTYTAADVRFEMLGTAAISTIIGPPNLEADPSWQAAVKQGRVRPQIIYRGPDGVVARVLKATPRARVISAAIHGTGTPADLPQIAAPPAGTDTALIESPLVTRTTAPRTPPPAIPATTTDHGPDAVSVDVTTPHAGWLVLTDSWSPGWEATVNGKDVTIALANRAQRAVPVPAGTSHVEFVYRPLGWPWAPILSVLFVVGGGAAALVGTIMVRRRRSPEAERTEA